MKNETKNFSRSFTSQPKPEQHIYLYCIESQRLIPIPIGSEIPSIITWASNDSSLYFATIQSNPSNDDDHLNNDEWKDVIQHRQWKPSDETKDFAGNIRESATRPDGGVYILGQVGTNVQIYTQQSSKKYTILQHGLDGICESISLSSSPHKNSTIAFVYSSYAQAKEVYVVDSIKQLESAKVITNENRLFTEHNLPRVKTFKWTSDKDDCAIEELLHYPPGKFKSTNLPLLVLIHSGPHAPNLNQFQLSTDTWGSLAATDGKDIHSGVHRLIQDGIVDLNRLAVVGYSYGGFLNNWLITQTTNFKAALSGSGSVDYVSALGTMKFPPLIDYLMGGFPWDTSDIYAKLSPIYQLDKVRTPTLIVTGEVGIRVPPGQNFMLERARHYLGVPVQLLIFPTERHSFRNNPWHGKIKVREELKWLNKYGHQN
ncbi:unnamed protein product [Rotaria magnacalcarata]|uniref:Peptidase S9 prolyl oligopeptidase catalytic domain-containing protein n=1 Tax=Rotaria magnacalcarata TaxID=392030 RepID=A0A816YTY2_9BILA|nr:unnamed protein product [Rotaria magnacalcarata]